MTDQTSAEDRIRSIANILSLVAIIGGMDKAAVQRVLVTLGENADRGARPLAPSTPT